MRVFPSNKFSIPFFIGAGQIENTEAQPQGGFPRHLGNKDRSPEAWEGSIDQVSDSALTVGEPTTFLNPKPHIILV